MAEARGLAANQAHKTSHPALLLQHGAAELLRESHLLIRLRLLSVAFDIPLYRILRLLLVEEVFPATVFVIHQSTTLARLRRFFE